MLMPWPVSIVESRRIVVLRIVIPISMVESNRTVLFLMVIPIFMVESRRTVLLRLLRLGGLNMALQEEAEVFQLRGEMGRGFLRNPGEVGCRRLALFTWWWPNPDSDVC